MRCLADSLCLLEVLVGGAAHPRYDTAPLRVSCLQSTYLVEMQSRGAAITVRVLRRSVYASHRR